MLEEDASLLDLTVDIVSAYVANNHVATASVADLIRSVHGSLIGLNDLTAVAQSYVKNLPSALSGQMSFKKFMSTVESDTNRAIAAGKNG